MRVRHCRAQHSSRRPFHHFFTPAFTLSKKTCNTSGCMTMEKQHSKKLLVAESARPKLLHFHAPAPASASVVPGSFMT